jgi:hypothetical protein
MDGKVNYVDRFYLLLWHATCMFCNHNAAFTRGMDGLSMPLHFLRCAGPEGYLHDLHGVLCTRNCDERNQGRYLGFQTIRRACAFAMAMQLPAWTDAWAVTADRSVCFVLLYIS